MNNVILFPCPVSIEVCSGVVLQSSNAAEVGKASYFIDVIEADGGRIGMWDGIDYVEAMQQASLLALDFGGKVYDLTGGVE